VSKWFQKQIWCDLLLAHWRVDPDELRRVMPPALPLHLSQDAQGDTDAQGMADQIGIGLEGEPLLHVSGRQDTLIWPLERV
jgi:hypothetical protein